MNKPSLPYLVAASFAPRGWLTIAVLLFLGWLHVEYSGPVWFEWPATSTVIYFLGALQLVATLASGFADARARVKAANNAATIEVTYRERIAAAENELERMRDLPDPVRDAMSHGMTDADLIAVCNEYEGYCDRWYEFLGHDPGGMDFPRMPFPLWFKQLLSPEAAERNEYAEYLNRREDATQLGHVPDHACLTFNQWKDDAYWREKLAYHPTALIPLPDRTFLRIPYHPPFYHRPQGFEVINADL